MSRNTCAVDMSASFFRLLENGRQFFVTKEDRVWLPTGGTLFVSSSSFIGVSVLKG